MITELDIDGTRRLRAAGRARRGARRPRRARPAARAGRRPSRSRSSTSPASPPQAHDARPLGRAARCQRPPPGRVRPVGADRGVGVGRGMGHRAHAHRATPEKHQAEYVAEVDAVLAGKEELPTWDSGELVAPVIDSLVTGTRRELPLNLPNTGQCPDLPADAVVESICVVDGDGIRGRDAARAPAPLAELLRRHVAVQEMTVEAALQRRPGAGPRGLRPRPAGGARRPARHRGHGRGAAGRHGAVAPAVRLTRCHADTVRHDAADRPTHDRKRSPREARASSASEPWGCP